MGMFWVFLHRNSRNHTVLPLRELKKKTAVGMHISSIKIKRKCVTFFSEMGSLSFLLKLSLVNILYTIYIVIVTEVGDPNLKIPGFKITSLVFVMKYVSMFFQKR